MRQGQGQRTRGVCGWVAWTGAWWSRFLLASAVAFGILTPAVAIAAPSSDDTAAADARDTTGSAAASERRANESAAGMCQCQSCARQSAVQSHAQSEYQPGTNRAMAPETPDHPYSQSHYQLGAGHQD